MMGLMSQLPGGDVSSSESSEEETNPNKQDPNTEKNGLDLVSPLASETQGNSKKDSSLQSKTSGPQLLSTRAEVKGNFSKKSYEVVSSITEINFEHLSCMQVLETNRLIVGGRWFGIYSCELDTSDDTIVTKKKLVDESKLFHQIVRADLRQTIQRFLTLFATTKSDLFGAKAEARTKSPSLMARNKKPSRILFPKVPFCICGL